MSFLRIVLLSAALLLVADAAQAQFRGGYGYSQRQNAFFQVRTGPYSSFTYSGSGYGYGFGSIYGPVPSWYYGYPGIPIVNNPIQVQPPIIVNNIIQAPQAPAVVPPRPPVIPAEFGQVALPAPKPLPPVPKKLVEPAKPMLGQPDADRVAEAGRKAFADGQYGRALELFQRVATITPNEPSVHFLISQAQFALGKYREAVSSIADGIALRVDWSDARFVARDLYWKKPAIFDDHLRPLIQAVEAFPDDAGLLFLLGHELWFDGKREEAKPLVLKARKLGKSPAESFGVQ
ncbi:MAG: hypothetical protein EXS09_02100 [Gemmataceae bacterium]|nr:hypothetical protein [Gemmataceae bacterium]